MAAMDIDNGRAQPYALDLGNLLCIDPNPLPSLSSAATPAEKESILSATAQSCAQALIHQLLAQPIMRSESDGALQITLPAPETPLPREKPVPKEKEKTKWEKFAEKKGIKARRKDGKLEFDENSKEWKAKYGFGSKGRRAPGEVSADWIVEVDEKMDREKKEVEGKKGHGGKTKKGEGDNARREKKMRARSKK